jgi:DNA-binding NarL/FixJ family response regulator
MIEISCLNCNEVIQNQLSELELHTPFKIGLINPNLNVLTHHMSEKDGLFSIVLVHLTGQYTDLYLAESISAIHHSYPILVSANTDPNYISLIVKSKYKGVIHPEEINLEQLKLMISSVFKYGKLINNHIDLKQWNEFAPYVHTMPIPPFTDREKQVLHLLCHHYTGKQICDLLCTSLSNVRKIVTRLKRRSNCATEKELIITAIINCWVFPITFSKNNKLQLSDLNKTFMESPLISK